MKLKYISAVVGVALVSAIGLLPSCKKYADPPPYFEDDQDTTVLASRRVLLIGIDGAVSAEVKTIAPATITGLLTHAKFQWDGVADESTTDATSWKTLMTGVSFAKHKIQDSTFIYTPPPGSDSHNGLPPNYPSMFSYIVASSRGNMRTSFISPWPNLVNKAVPEVRDQVITSGDQGVKDSALARIRNGNPDFITLNFNSPAIAGKAGGFTGTNTAYRDAITKVDGYINELIAALKARPQYNKNEEWLVVIKSTHGGLGTGYGGSTPTEANSFTIFYNERFKPTEFKKADYTSALITGRDANTVKATVENDGGFYDIGTGSQTIQVKIKGGAPFNYPHFMGKTSAFGQTGWTMFTNSGGVWCFSFRTSTVGERRLQDGSNVFDNKWHTLTAVIYDSAGSRWVKRFTDGIRIADNNTTRNLGTSSGTITSTSPLSLGWGGDRGYNAMTYNTADFQIFNSALTDEEVSTNLCLKDITKHPKYASLIGYWPCNDGFGSQFNNLAPGRSGLPLKLSGPFNWASDPLIPCNITASTIGAGQAQMMLSSASIAKTLFYWLRVPVSDSWGFEGSNWLQNYEIEFVGL